MALPNPFQFRFHRRVRFVPQLEASECGAASLAMVLEWHGHSAPLAKVRSACGISRDGTTAHSILKAANAFGLDGEAVTLELNHLGWLPLPAILHWDFSHFLVLEKLTTEGAILVDPASGRRSVTTEELHRRFTGVALVFAPSDSFTKLRRQKPSLRRYRSVISNSVPSLTSILVASLVLQAVGMAFPIATQLLIDRAITPHDISWLFAIGIGLAGATAAKVAFGAARAKIIQSLQARIDTELLSNFVDHLLFLPLGFFSQRSTGDLLQRVQANEFVRDVITSKSVSALLDSLLLAGLAVLMLAYSLPLAGIVISFGIIRIVLLLAFRDRSQQLMSTELVASGKEWAVLVESLTTLETLKASGTEQRMASKWVDRMVVRVNAGLQRRKLEHGASQWMTLMQGASGAAVLWLGGNEVLAGRMTLGTFASFISLQGLFLTPLESLVSAVSQFQFLGNQLGRLDDVLETPREASGAADPGKLSGSISLLGVDFAYGPEAPLALEGICLSISPGEKIALVGPSGAGKSTLARLLMGLHLPTKGEIRFDDRNLKDLDLQMVRKQMGIVLQDTFLFDDSIHANLTLNDPTIPVEMIRWATKQACILDAIEGLPKGFETIVGENGHSLSGGQRQRLSIARAIVHCPSILLLDEATSALDLTTEAMIHSNIAGLGCTRIVIAHRLATVRDADRILVIVGGRIVQSGKFEALLKEQGPFQEIVSAMETAIA